MVIKKKWQKADDYYDKGSNVLKKDGDKQSILLIDTYTSKAFALSHRKGIKRRMSYARESQRDKPERGIDLSDRRKTIPGRGTEDEAAISFEKAIEINPNIEMWYRIASAYSESDYPIEAKRILGKKWYQIKSGNTKM